MLNLNLIRLRLRQYGLVWLGAFGAVLSAAFLIHYLGGMDYIAVADLLLTAAFPTLGLILVAFSAFALVAPQPPLTRAVLVALALVLALPLLWAPVLGVVAGAWVADVSIEYSSVYATFRIVVGRLLYTVTDQIFGSPLVEAAWNVMQGFAALVGFISAVVHSWRAIQSLSREPSV